MCCEAFAVAGCGCMAHANDFRQTRQLLNLGTNNSGEKDNE